MKLFNGRIAFGFDWIGSICVGVHVHPLEQAIMVDFLGHYLNIDLSKVPDAPQQGDLD